LFDKIKLKFLFFKPLFKKINDKKGEDVFRLVVVAPGDLGQTTWRNQGVVGKTVQTLPRRIDQGSDGVDMRRPSEQSGASERSGRYAMLFVKQQGLYYDASSSL